MSDRLNFGFNRPVPARGYAWWYIDALSDDGADALTLIGFVGSVFSPYYAWAGRAEPEAHNAVNVALYRKGSSRWSMTERGRHDLTRTEDFLQVGPSAMSLRDGQLFIDINERGWPVPSKVKGRVRVIPEVTGGTPLVLSQQGQHHWWPIAPRARVEVSFDEPAVQWAGTGYVDSNWGGAPLEEDFKSWTWSRAPLQNGAVVLYDVARRSGENTSMALRFNAGAARTVFEPPPPVALPSSLFGIARSTRSEGQSSIVKTLTDAHFYARSLIQTNLCGEAVVGVHESLELDRYRTAWAKWMLPFRMPRRARSRPALPVPSAH